jgi:uncharacterized membrane protein (DUF2068 family)
MTSTRSPRSDGDTDGDTGTGTGTGTDTGIGDDAGTGWQPAVGATGGRKVRYELIGCALAGHDLPLAGSTTPAGSVGPAGSADAAGLTGPGPGRTQDPALVRELDGLTWHRCLRCDAWLPLPPGVGRPRGKLARRRRRARAKAPAPVEEAADEAVRGGVEPPLRGRPLRDRYVLRLIALDRAVHVLVLAVLGIAVLLFVNHRTALKNRITRAIADLQGGGAVQDSGHGIVHDVERVFALGTGSLYAVAVGVFAYAALEATEMVGLWFARRWAEYLTFLATLVLIPLEIDELVGGFSTLKVLTFLLNVAIAVYLLFSKRLFGIRGGGRAEDAERRHDSGWTPIDRATPPTAG